MSIPSCSTAGGPGSAGGQGGSGGGGAGGSSYAWVAVGAGKVLEDAVSVYDVGPAGLGGGGAPSGASGKSIVVPSK